MMLLKDGVGMTGNSRCMYCGSPMGEKHAVDCVRPKPLTEHITWSAPDLYEPPNASGIIPVEYFVVVELDPTEEKTAGGIILTKQTQDADKLAGQEGTLIAVSPHAFTYADNWPEGTVPQIGQRVLFKRYDGVLHERDGKNYRILNDKSVIAILEPRDAASARKAA